LQLQTEHRETFHVIVLKPSNDNGHCSLSLDSTNINQASLQELEMTVEVAGVCSAHAKRLRFAGSVELLQRWTVSNRSRGFQESPAKVSKHVAI